MADCPSIPLWIDPHDSRCRFPDVSLALEEPNGLLAIGGNLEPQRLIAAYRNGIFPWYCAEQPPLWWSPDPRSVLFPARLKVSRSLRKTLKRGLYEVTLDTAFDKVIAACATLRCNDDGTWLTPEMIDAYCQLHEMGHAHSAEAWCEGELAGGLYGVALGKLFFGESMFYRRRDASKVAFVRLVRELRAWDYKMIDCQISSAHLASLGAEEIPRDHFISMVKRWRNIPGHPFPWRFSGQ